MLILISIGLSVNFTDCNQNRRLWVKLIDNIFPTRPWAGGKKEGISTVLNG
ncbi:MAG: hypothetical protein LBR79_01625 [Oscillospiraceae bacterium]|nr:hypothetical protein [Oscillospiraceae bacterium]